MMCIGIIAIGLLSFACSCHGRTVRTLEVVDVYEYDQFSIVRHTVPENTQLALVSYSLPSTRKPCPSRTAMIYINDGAIPFFNFENESVPSSFAYEQQYSQKVRLTSGSTMMLNFNQTRPEPGDWFSLLFLERRKDEADERLQPAIFQSRQQCPVTVVEIRTFYNVSDVDPVPIDINERVVNFTANQKITFRYYVAPGKSLSYVIVRAAAVRSVINSFSVPCRLRSSDDITAALCVLSPSSSCRFRMSETESGRWNEMSLLSFTQCSALVSIKLEECSTCVSLVRGVYHQYDFDVVFLYRNPLALGLQPITLKFSVVSLEDSGGTLHISVDIRHQLGYPSYGDVTAEMCLHRGHFLTNLTLGSFNHEKNYLKHGSVREDNSSACSAGGGYPFTARITSHGGPSQANLYVPYPQSGEWYLTAQCFNNSAPGGGILIPCRRFVLFYHNVSLSSCVGGQCGKYGTCALHLSGNILYSRCKCIAGWRGYACSDGSLAESDASQLTDTLLLTLSNFCFLPAAVLAFHRGLVAESLVYLFIAVFSTIYHACDSNNIYSYCAFEHDALQEFDFFGAVLAFWVTLVAMSMDAGLLKSFLSTLGCLGVLVGARVAVTSSWLLLAPIGLGVVILLASWIHKCRRRSGCYPPKKRWLFCITPGIVLALAGVVIYLFLETSSNYASTHSAWHLTIALSIPFLLPPASQNRRGSPGLLSPVSVFKLGKRFVRIFLPQRASRELTPLPHDSSQGPSSSLANNGIITGEIIPNPSADDTATKSSNSSHRSGSVTDLPVNDLPVTDLPVDVDSNSTVTVQSVDGVKGDGELGEGFVNKAFTEEMP